VSPRPQLGTAAGSFTSRCGQRRVESRGTRLNAGLFSRWRKAGFRADELSWTSRPSYPTVHWSHASASRLDWLGETRPTGARRVLRTSGVFTLEDFAHWSSVRQLWTRHYRFAAERCGTEERSLSARHAVCCSSVDTDCAYGNWSHKSYVAGGHWPTQPLSSCSVFAVYDHTQTCTSLTAIFGSNLRCACRHFTPVVSRKQIPAISLDEPSFIGSWLEHFN